MYIKNIICVFIMYKCLNLLLNFKYNSLLKILIINCNGITHFSLLIFSHCKPFVVNF